MTQLEDLVKKWRERAAACEYGSMAEGVAAYDICQCADELEAVLKKMQPSDMEERMEELSAWFNQHTMTSGSVVHPGPSCTDPTKVKPK